MRNAYQVRLSKAGPDVVFAELDVSELVRALKLAGSAEGAELEVRTAEAAMALCLRQVDGVAVDSGDVQLRGLKTVLPRTRHFFALRQAWQRVHLPSPADVEELLATLQVEFDGATELWSVTLPTGRRVVFAELEVRTVGAALRAAQELARAPAAQELLAILEQGRRAVRQVDGRHVSADDLVHWDQYFSVKETFCLGRALNEAHMGGGDVDLGGLMPVPVSASGTPSPTQPGTGASR